MARNAKDAQRAFLLVKEIPPASLLQGRVRSPPTVLARQKNVHVYLCSRGRPHALSDKLAVSAPIVASLGLLHLRTGSQLRLAHRGLARTKSFSEPLTASPRLTLPVLPSHDMEARHSAANNSAILQHFLQEQEGPARGTSRMSTECAQGSLRWLAPGTMDTC